MVVLGCSFDLILREKESPWSLCVNPTILGEEAAQVFWQAENLEKDS
jgi:hypothetical protein